jgi:DNA-binding transcriptional MocR family regulator
MAKKKDTAPAAAGISGDVDTTYMTQQRDMFSSGLAAQIGVYAYTTWCAIKYHSDFQTGQSWPGIRHLATLVGASKASIEKAILDLEAAHLLRVDRRGRKNVYIARERMDVRIGDRVICSIAIDYVPAQMREKLAALRGAAAGEIESADVWAEVEIIPGPGMEHDPNSGTYKGRMRADEVPSQADLKTAQSVDDARKKLRLQRDEIAAAAGLRGVLKK